MCVVTLTLLITIVICYGPSMHIIYTSSIASYSYYMASIVGIISRQMDGLRLIDVAQYVVELEQTYDKLALYYPLYFHFISNLNSST